MSRGPGRLQSLILGELSTEKLTQLNELRWRLWEKESGTNNSDMRKSFYVSLNRSIDLLNDRLVRRKRKLKDLRELLQYYAFRTHSYQIRDLRQQLLPLVEEFIGENGTRYTESENEEFLFRSLPRDEQRGLIRDWNEIEPKIFQLIGSSNPERSRLLVQVIPRAWELFRIEKHVSIRRSLGSLIRDTFELPKLESAEQSVKDELSTLMTRCFPGSALPRVRLKSQLYRAFYLGKSIRPHLTQDFEDFLVKKHFDFLESLPGHQSAKSKHVGKYAFLIPAKDRLSPLLDKIIDRDIFSSFEFIRLK
jgi:hypothetical protein